MMASNLIVYTRGDEYPGLTLPWQYESTANTWTDLDLSSGYTFVATLISAAGTSNALDATVTGANGSVGIGWAADDLDLAPGVYTLKLVASHTATSNERSYSPGNPVRIQIV